MLVFASLGLTLSIVLILVFYALLVVADWKIFEKAGEAGWKSIIPFYNIYITFKITWTTNAFWIMLACSAVAAILPKEGFWALIAGACALTGSVIMIIDYNKLARAFGHGIGYTLGLMFLPNVFTLILGFGSDLYLGPQ